MEQAPNSLIKYSLSWNCSNWICIFQIVLYHASNNKPMNMTTVRCSFQWCHTRPAKSGFYNGLTTNTIFNHRVPKTWVSGWHCHPESFCASGKFLRATAWNCNGEFPDPLENFQIVWIFSGLSGKFLDSLESFRIGWIFSGWSWKFPDIFRMIRKISGQRGKFLDSLESFWIGWKVSV